MTATSKTLLRSAAQRTSRMIDQEAAQRQLEAALSPGDTSFQVVLVRAEGGMGKTRLLEEILARHGPPTDDRRRDPAWQPHDDLIVAELVDVIDTRLHDSYRFVTELRNSLKPYGGRLDFGGFDAADDKVKLLTASGARLESVDKAQRNAIEAFVVDLAYIVTQRRVVFLVDTVERLSYEASEWLLQKGLLRYDDMAIRTHQWLQRFIADTRLGNITLVLTGRGREGAHFFNRVQETVATSSTPVYPRHSSEVTLQRFSLNQTQRYLTQLAEDWQEEDTAIARNFAYVADEARDHAKVIGLYTHGIPVRLALYAQVLVGGRRMPSAFRLSFAEACRPAGLDPEAIDLDAELSDDASPELRRIQWDVEEEFVDLLFSDPNDRYTAVLRTLVRAPRGLTAEQLHFALDAPPGMTAEAWQKSIRDNQAWHQEEIDGLRQLLQGIATSYLGKRRAAVEEFHTSEEESEQVEAVRVGLQDEIYRIYAEHRGLLAEPVSPETEPIRAALSAADRRRYAMNREDEIDARVTLYERLADFADAEYCHLLEKKRAYLLEDERQFEERFRLEDINTFLFQKRPKTEEDERRLLHTVLMFFEIERMVYRLLQDPEHNLNSEYITLEDDNARAAQQEEDFWAQAEMWRALHDDWLMKFVDLHTRDAAEKRGETAAQVLRRFAEQENVARWIKRLVLRSSAEREIGGQEREIDFAEAIQDYISTMPRGLADGNKQEKDEYHAWGSWNHTLAAAERIIWTQVAYIRRGRDVDGALKRIAEQIHNLETLYTKSVREQAFNNEGHVENGFAAAPATADKPEALPQHPAYTRLGRLLSLAYNHVGYGERTLGKMHQAVVYYGRSLGYARAEPNKLQAHLATVLNNLSRALSELGWNGIGVCLDGRDLRWEVAEEVPLATSYNTLALIYDDMGRYEEAPLLAAKAIAYCRRATESRQLGLALRQMAESLRHLAERPRTGQRISLPAEAYFSAAEQLLREARTIFEELRQVERLVEVNLEMGSLYRDRLDPHLSLGGRPPIRTRAGRSAYSDALTLLDTAEQRATEHNLVQHVLDARVNKARTHYYVGDIAAAKSVLDAIEADATYQHHLIKPERTLPDSADDTLRDRSWIFRHLGTAQWIRGWMALDQFQICVEYHRTQHPADTPADRQARAEAVRNDPKAQTSLREAASVYALGIAYAQLHSPRSRAITTMQNDLYFRFRASNRLELESLQGYLREVNDTYRACALESVPMLLKFLNEFFGLSEPNAEPASAAQPANEGKHDRL